MVGVVEHGLHLGELDVAVVVAETDELLEVEHGGHDGLLFGVVVAVLQIDLLMVDVGRVDRVGEVELVPLDLLHQVPVLHRVVVVQIPQQKQPVGVVIDAYVRVVDQLIIQQQVVLFLRKHHEVHAHSVLRLISHVILVDGGVLDVGELGVQRLLLEL